MPKITWLTSYGHQALTRSLIRDRNTLCTTASPPAVCWTGEDALPTTTKVFYIKQFAFFKTVDSIAGTHLSASPKEAFSSSSDKVSSAVLLRLQPFCWRGWTPQAVLYLALPRAMYDNSYNSWSAAVARNTLIMIKNGAVWGLLKYNHRFSVVLQRPSLSLLQQSSEQTKPDYRTEAPSTKKKTRKKMLLHVTAVPPTAGQQQQTDCLSFIPQDLCSSL